MLRALRERGVDPDLMTGTSVRALNGAIHAAGSILSATGTPGTAVHGTFVVTY